MADVKPEARYGGLSVKYRVGIHEFGREDLAKRYAEKNGLKVESIDNKKEVTTSKTT